MRFELRNQLGTLSIALSILAVVAFLLGSTVLAEDTNDAARMNFSAQEIAAQQLKEVRNNASIPPGDHGKWLNEKIPTADGPVNARTWLERNPGSRSGAIHLVADPAFLSAMEGKLPGKFVVHLIDEVGQELVEKVAGGDCLVWIGRGDKLPTELSVRAFTPAAGKLAVEFSDQSPLITSDVEFTPTELQSGYVKPHSDPAFLFVPRHNVDEEVRAEFLPVLIARDRFGQEIGYPGVLMSHYAPSLARGRFEGSDCYFFFFDKPLDATAADGWAALLSAIWDRFESGLQVRQLSTDFASYQTGKRIRVTARVHNSRDTARSLEVEFLLKSPSGSEFKPRVTERRVAERGSDTEVVVDFKTGTEAGLWRIKAVVRQDPKVASLPGMRGIPRSVECREEAFVVFDGQLKTDPIVKIDGMGIVIDGENSFIAGSTYYPSSSWWEWLWRDFHPGKADEAFASMRRHGYRLVRIWLDPIQNEQTLRATDAMIYLAARHGIVLDACVFTQWVRTMGYEQPDGSHVRFDFRPLEDFNMYGVSLRNLDHQRTMMRNYAERWRHAGNLFYNLSNEVYVKDPSHDQMDAEAEVWDEELALANGVARDSALFRRWADMLTKVVRDAGGEQPVIPGYMFDFSRNYGGDTYQGNLHGEIVPWHDYGNAEIKGDRIPYFDPQSSNRPSILEEFGGIDNTSSLYDGSAHYALASGTAACMAYEWGISWFARESCYASLELYEYAIQPDGGYDPRFFTEVIGDVSNNWSPLMVGIAPWPSGYWNSSIYDCTPFPMPAALQLGRMGLMGRNLGRTRADYSTYVIVPTGGIRSFDKTAAIFQQLRKQKVVFGIWQERDLADLPDSARIVVWPSDEPETTNVLEHVRQKKVEVFRGIEPALFENSALESIATKDAEGLQLFTRSTIGGTLYCLFGTDSPRDSIEMTAGKHQLQAGWNRFVMMQVGTQGVTLLEASGAMRLDGEEFCVVDKGRLLAATEDELPLPKCERLRLTVSEPTHLRFARRIASLSATDGAGHVFPIASQEIDADGKGFFVDDDVQRYAIQVTFNK